MSKVVFISYSWDNDEHKADLIKNGVDVILDQYDLSVGHEMTYFMEKAMSADKVLVILTTNYKIKGEKREGGVGFEYSLLTKELYDSVPNQSRIIPILRVGDSKSSSPIFMQTKVYHDMRDNSKYDSKLFELIKLIIDKPLAKKPPLGDLPAFDDNIAPDIDKTITDFKKKEEFVGKKKGIINSSEGVKLFTENVNSIISQISETLGRYKTNFNLHTYVKKDQRPSIVFTTVNFTAYFAGELRASNTADEAFVKLNFYKGPVGFDDLAFDYWAKPELIYSHKYNFDLDENLKPIFSRSDAPLIRLVSNELATSLLRDLIANEIKLRDSKL